MNIEQNLVGKELNEEEYTKVYAGSGAWTPLENELFYIQPETPKLPSGPGLASSHQQPLHTGIFGG